MSKRDVIVIGASAGGVEALCTLVSLLPKDLPAAVFIVQHIGDHPSHLPQILNASGTLKAVHAENGVNPVDGHIYVAPPDRHLLLQDGKLLLTHGPKENHTRPAIDPLFRSAALSCGPRVMGVVLSGFLDDGTAGLKAIKDCGGLALVQDPNEAEHGDMPGSALAHVEVDYCGRVAMLAMQLSTLAGEQVGPRTEPANPATLIEHFASIGEGTMIDNLRLIGKPSALACPECNGSLWEMNDRKPVRYRCHTGHAYTLGHLAHSQTETVEATCWSAVRALQDLEYVLREVASVSAENGDTAKASAAGEEAARAAEQALSIERLIEKSLRGNAGVETKS